MRSSQFAYASGPPVGLAVGVASRCIPGGWSRPLSDELMAAPEELLAAYGVHNARRRNWFTGMSPYRYAGTQLSQDAKKVCGVRRARALCQATRRYTGRETRPGRGIRGCATDAPNRSSRHTQ